MPDQIEIKRNDLYHEGTGNCWIEGVGTILIMLANEENKHFNTIALLKKQKGDCSPVKGKVLENVNNVFLRLKEEEPGEYFNCAELDYYRKTLKFEEVIRLFYLKNAAEAELEDERQLFYSLAEEGERYLRKLETILEFIDRPEPVKGLIRAERQQAEA
jgi:hypothetical protein